MRYLYQKKHELADGNDYVNEFLNSCRIEELRPLLFRCKLKCERITFKERLSRLYFGLITGWKYRIYVLLDGVDVVHTSYVVPKCYKFPFLEKNDFEIGPCVTKSKYRRRGSYNYILQYISSLPHYNKSRFYMIVKSTNEPSIKGIEKSGFVHCGYIKKTKFLKIYKKQQI